MPRVLEKYNMKDLGSARAIKILMQENASLKNALPTAHISTTSTQLTDSAEGLPIEHVKIKGATSQVQYEGKNLWGGISYTKSSNSVDFEQKSDGSIIVNGTSTGNASSLMSADAVSNGYTKTLSAGTYVLSGGTSNVLLQVVRSDGSTVVSTTSQEFSKTFTLSAETVVFVRATVGNGVTVNNETVYIQLEEGSTAHDWEPYVGGQPAPNPAYPQLIHRVTGDCNAKVQNKNLFDTNKNPKILNASIEENIDAGKRLVNTIANTSYTNGLYSLMDLSNYVGKTVRVKANIQASAENTGRYAIGLSDSNVNNKIQQAFTNVSGSELAFVVPNLTGTVTYLYLGLYSNAGGNAQAQDYVDYTDIVITIDNEDMTYIPHAEQNAPLSLGNIEAYEDDEIQIDYVQKAGYKKVTGARLVSIMGYYTFTGEENFSKGSSTDLDKFVLSTYKLPTAIRNIYGAGSISQSVIYCTHFTAASINEHRTTKGYFYTNNGPQLIFNFAEYGTTTVEDFKQFLAENQVKVAIKQNNPVTTEITDPTLLAQLETLINMKTYKEVTNIDCTGEDLAPVLDCDYYQDMSTVKSDIASIKARLDLLEE